MCYGYSHAKKLIEQFRRAAQRSGSSSGHSMKHLKLMWAEIKRRPFDDITLLLCASVLLGFMGTQGFGWAPVADALLRGVGLLILLALLVALNVGESRLYDGALPSGTAVIMLLLRVLLIEGIVFLEQFGIANILYLIVPMKAFLYFPPLFAYLFSFALLGIFFVRLNLVKPEWYSSVTGAYTFLLFAVGVLLTSYSAGLIARERRSRLHAEKLLSDLEISHQRLARYARQAGEAAMIEERNRLAREIHDGLGHYLTAINIQLEKALVFHTLNPEESLQSLRDARHLGSEALEDVRHSVSALRDSQQGFALQTELERLVETAARNGLHVNLVVQGSSSGFSNQVLLALYRAAQEGLTNVQRHAAARQVELAVCFSADAACMTLRDDGCGFDVSTQSIHARQQAGRYGLTGLQERLALVNGQLMIESQLQSGTTLRVHVPREYAVTA